MSEPGNKRFSVHVSVRAEFPNAGSAQSWARQLVKQSLEIATAAGYVDSWEENSEIIPLAEGDIAEMDHAKVIVITPQARGEQP